MAVTTRTVPFTGSGDGTADIMVDPTASGDIQVVKIGLGATPALDTLVDSGQQTSANSLPVVIASDQSDLPVAGDTAHDAADNGNPLKIGFKAKSFDGSAPGTDVAEDDRVDAIADPSGRQYVNKVHPNYWTYAFNGSAAQTNTVIHASPGAGLALYITDVVLSALTAQTIVLQDEDDTVVIPIIYLGANGNVSMHFETPVRVTTAKALEFDSTAAVAHSVLVQGYIAA